MAPVIIGTPTVGVASAYTLGTVSGSPTITQQWTLDGADIVGETGSTYTPISGDATHLLRVREIATNGFGSANSTSASATVAATGAPGALSTTFTLTSPNTATAPFTIGHAFKQGDVSSAQDVAVTGATAQVTKLNAWPDGSLKFAIIAGTASLTAATPATIGLAIGTASSGTALTTANLKTAMSGQTCSIACGSFGTVSWATTDFDSPFKTPVSGAQMSSWVYRKPVGSDPHLVGWIEVRLFLSGAVEVLPWIENGYLNVASPINKSATYSFTLGSTSRYSGSIDFPAQTRSPLVSGTNLSHWLGTDPAVSVLHDVAYLQSTSLVPSYRAVVASGATVVSSLVSTYTPLQLGNHNPYMPDFGYFGSIGILPEWDVLYLTCTTSTKPWVAVQLNAYGAGRYAMHFRDETTNRTPIMSAYPNLVVSQYGPVGLNHGGSSGTGTYTPQPSGTQADLYDIPHSPAFGVLAYLVTGRWYFMEEVQFQAFANYLTCSTAPRQSGLGIMNTISSALTTRGAGWAFRTLTHAAVVTPDSDTALRNEFLARVESNIDFYHGVYIAQTNNPFGWVKPYSDYTAFSPQVTGSGSTTTAIVLTGSSDIAGDYLGWSITIGGQTRTITGYTLTPKTATVSVAFSSAPASGVTYALADGIYWEAAWMQDFFTTAYGYAKAMKPAISTASSARLDAFFAWKAQSIVGRLGGVGSTEFLYRDAAPYTVPVSPSDSPDFDGGTGPWYSDWGATYAANYSATGVSGSTTPYPLPGTKTLGDLRGAYYPDSTSFWGNLQPAISYAVQHGVTGAAAAYDRMIEAGNWPAIVSNMNATPVWSIRPATLPAWRTAMVNRTWAKVGAIPSTVNPENDATINPNYPSAAPWHDTGGFPQMIGSWSSGVFNRSTDDLWIHGGGHADYMGNEVLGMQLNATSPTWRIVRKPTGCIGNTGTLDDGQEATGLYFDGRPRATHTYNSLTIAGDVMWRMPAPFVSRDPNQGTRKFFKFNGTDWTSLGDAPFSVGGEGGACYDPTRNKIIWVNSDTDVLRTYDITANTWAADSHYNNISGASRPVYIPGLDVVCILNNTSTRKFCLYDFGRTTGGTNLPVPPATGTPPSSMAYPTGEWVPALGAIVIWNGGTGFDVLTPPASGDPATTNWAWSRLEADGANTVTPDTQTSNGVFGRFFYSPNLRCLGVINATSQQINVFALDS